MKKFTLTFAILCAFCTFAFSGTEQYSGKETKEVLQPAPPPCEWYRAHEWDIMIWGTYAFSGNTGEDVDDEFFIDGIELEFSHNSDRLLDEDDVFGGGADIKYFFSKYWGLGVQGFVLDTNNVLGGGLATFTFRFPIGCTRFAPYVWAGGGFISGGSHTEHFRVRDSDTGELLFEDNVTSPNRQTEPVGQFGGGVEVRITQPSDMSKLAVGVMADVCWNVVDDTHNNFGMARLGFSLSY